jgi:hypothetical protein
MLMVMQERQLQQPMQGRRLSRQLQLQLQQLRRLQLLIRCSSILRQQQLMQQHPQAAGGVALARRLQQQVLGAHAHAGAAALLLLLQPLCQLQQQGLARSLQPRKRRLQQRQLQQQRKLLLLLLLLCQSWQRFQRSLRCRQLQLYQCQPLQQWAGAHAAEPLALLASPLLQLGMGRRLHSRQGAHAVRAAGGAAQ